MGCLAHYDDRSSGGEDGGETAYSVRAYPASDAEERKAIVGLVQPGPSGPLEARNA